MPERSLGTHLILTLVDQARQEGLPHVYLGYWIEGSRKMDYKRRFQPLEALGRDGWLPLDPVS
jgi:arginine-tRNA-protein transferase